MLTPTNASAATNETQVYVTTSTTAATINFGVAGINASTYTYNYFIIETQA